MPTGTSTPDAISSPLILSLRITLMWSTGSMVTIYFVTIGSVFSKIAFISIFSVTSTVNFPSASGCVSMSFTVRDFRLYPSAGAILQESDAPLSTSSPDAMEASPFFTVSDPGPSAEYSTLNLSAAFSFTMTETVQSLSTSKVLSSITTPLTFMLSTT